ncbi:uncharacterized protein LOC126840989 [Adelges cooleyi]|uniref:uncharacterized protein LOC126840989 n=1 Tax=Adelges cooleyi TaxID=133065 RepID=UPI002180575B|nr:uncharacterized protein LOC126840989 [Adelges cooleyi]
MIDYQIIAREKIWDLTKILPTRMFTLGKYREVDLTDLGDQRRRITLEAIKTLIRNVIGGRNTNFGEFSDMCILIGLFKNIKYRTPLIVNAEINAMGACLLTHINNNVSRYHYIEDEIWEFDGTTIESFSFQLQ